MKRVIILEGPDGGGKTTLAEKLAPAMRAVVINHGPYPEITAPSLWLKYFHSMLPAYAGLHDVVLDRAWPAEPIYGDAFRGGANRIQIWQRRLLERVALGCDAVIVWCVPPFEACAAAWEARRGAEYLKTVGQLKAVHDGYTKLLGNGVVPSMWYDRTRPGALERVIDHVTDRGCWPINSGPGVGAWRPGESTLLIGERPGGRSGPHAAAFCGTRRDGVSAWLAELLEEADIPESKLYWVNAFGTADDSEPLNANFITALRPKKIFALGEVAARWADERSVDAVQVEHPQYWKRFFFHQATYPLIKELQSCLYF